MAKIKIVGLGGSLAPGSSSLAALKVALQGAEGAGAETALLDLAELDLPMYRPGATSPNAAVQRLVDETASAHGMLWSSPLYQGTISGAFKNALDWMQLLANAEPPYLTDKPVGLISTAGGTQGLQAVNTMEYVVRALRGWAVPLVVPVPKAFEEFDAEGHAKHPDIAAALASLGAEVTRAAGLLAAERLTTQDAQRAEEKLQPLSNPKP